MLKTGYALVDTRDNSIAQSFDETLEDGNGRPQLKIVIRDLGIEVHSPAFGEEFGPFKFVARYFDDPGAPSRWHSYKDKRAYDGGKIVTTRVYSQNPDLVPEAVTMVKARLTLLAAGLLDKVNAEISGLDPDVPENRAIQTMWEYATELHRSAPEIAVIAKIIGLSKERIDDLFRQAAS